MTFSINAKKREDKDADEVRVQDQIPGIVYGPEIEPISVAVDYNTFEKLYNEAGESTLIDLNVEGQKDPITVLIQDIQYDPVKGKMIHIDFRQIKMGEEMSATIELEFTGESAAVKSLGGTLNKSLGSVNVKCLPKNLVSSIEIDLGKLETFEDAIYIRDLVLPEGITITDNKDTMIAKVTPPLTEEQLKAMEESQAGDVAEVEVEGEKEGEEAEEGKEGEEKPEEKKEEKKDEGGEKKEKKEEGPASSANSADSAGKEKKE